MYENSLIEYHVGLPPSSMGKITYIALEGQYTLQVQLWIQNVKSSVLCAHVFICFLQSMVSWDLRRLFGSVHDLAWPFSANCTYMPDEVLELEFQGWKKKFIMLQVYSVDIAGSLYQRGNFLLGWIHLHHNPQCQGPFSAQLSIG